MDDPVDISFEPQRLRQQGDMDCGVSVFAELTGLSREEILRDVPEALNGLTADQWKAYLARKGVRLRDYGRDGPYPLPCAHLVETSPNSNSFHWIYQAENGGIHDPSPVFECGPPRTIKLATHYGAKVLTVGVEPVKRSS